MSFDEKDYQFELTPKKDLQTKIAMVSNSALTDSGNKLPQDHRPEDIDLLNNN